MAYIKKTAKGYVQGGDIIDEATLRENLAKNMVKEVKVKGKAQGGKIEGAGTGTSDSIKAKVEDGGFVVPAENAKTAEAMRAKYFGKPDKKAPLQSGNTDVKLSNGEHYFTKNEADYLRKAGVDLDSLAPNADGGRYMVEGGPVRMQSTGNKEADKIIDETYSNPPKTAAESKEIRAKINALGSDSDFNEWLGNIEAIQTSNEKLSGKTKEWINEANVYGVKLLNEGASKDEIKKYLDNVKSNSQVSSSGLSGTLSPAATYKTYSSSVSDRTKQAKAEQSLKDLDVAIANKYNRLQEARKNPRDYTAAEISTMDNAVQEAQKHKEILMGMKQEGEYGIINDYMAKNFSSDVDLKDKISAPSQVTSVPSVKKGLSEQGTTSAGTAQDSGQDVPNKQPKVTGTTETRKPGSGVAKSVSGIEEAPVFTSPLGTAGFDEIATPTPSDKKSFIPKYPGIQKFVEGDLAQKEQVMKDEAKARNPYIDSKTQTATDTSPLAGRQKDRGIGAEQAIALGQAGLGMQQLLKDGQRPEDVIDPAFDKTVRDAETEATFGISPLEREIANRSIERTRRAGIESIIGLSGGSAGTALANIQGANINADESAANLALGSEKLRLQKKQYADSLVAQRAGMKRQLFGDKLAAFEQDQQAGSMLLGKGIENYIGSLRYQKQLDATKEIEDKYKNVWQS